MPEFLRHFRFLCLGLSLAALAQPTLAQNLQPEESPKAELIRYSGFLNGIYEQLQDDKSPSGVKVKRWVSPALRDAAKHKNYRAVLVDRVVLYPEPKPSPEVSHSTLKQSTEYLTEQLKKAVSQALPLAEKPGQGVLRLSVAITAIESITKGLKPYELLPIALAAAAVKTAIGSRRKEANVALEWKLVDTGTRQTIAAGMRQGIGAELKADEGKITFEALKPALDSWVGDAGYGFTEIKHASKP